MLNEKADAVYYHGGQSVLKSLTVMTAATAKGKSTVLVLPEVVAGNKRYYKTEAEASALTEVTYGSAITPSEWTELTSNGMQITPTSSHKVIRVVEVDSSNNPLAVGDAVLNIG